MDRRVNDWQIGGDERAGAIEEPRDSRARSACRVIRQHDSCFFPRFREFCEFQEDHERRYTSPPRGVHRDPSTPNRSSGPPTFAPPKSDQQFPLRTEPGTRPIRRRVFARAAKIRSHPPLPAHSGAQRLSSWTTPKRSTREENALGCSGRFYFDWLLRVFRRVCTNFVS